MIILTFKRIKHDNDSYLYFQVCILNYRIIEAYRLFLVNFFKKVTFINAT